jgi:hypothetical protein
MRTDSERPPRLARLARSPLVWIAVLVTLGCLMRGVRVKTRGMSLVSEVPPVAAPRETAALFVGVQRFTSTPPPADVPYAVDDAVDLASSFARRIGDKTHIAIAISGEPQKPASKEALRKLREAGATVVEATKENVQQLLEQQARIAAAGELIVSFATHGFTHDGVPYVLASTSSFEDQQSAISTAEILDIAARAKRSFVVLDACRDRISVVRGGSHRVDTRAPPIGEMRKYAGQVVFAPAAGRTTEDEFRDKNGVFTGAILSGLHGGAACDMRGYVTVDTLRDYVEQRMMRWLKRRYDDAEPPAIQVNIDGDAGSMPLATCNAGPGIARVEHTDSSIDAFDTGGHHLWGKRFEDAVIDADVAKPDNIVIALTAHHVQVFDATGIELWKADLGKDVFGETLLIQRLIRGAKQNQIVVLATGDGGSTIAMWDADGTARGAYHHPEHLRDVQEVRLTTRHGWKLVAVSKSSVLMLDPKKLTQPLWLGVVQPAGAAIRSLSTDDPNHDEKLDLAITLASGGTLYVDFDGRRMAGGDADDTRFEPLHQRPASARRSDSAHARKWPHVVSR